jgi:hypothetical protein
MTFRIGFEADFYSELGRKDLRASITEKLGFNTILSRPEVPKHYNKWYLLKTPFLRSSGETISGRKIVSHELVSPIMSLEDGATALWRLSDFLIEESISSNDTVLQVTL